MKLELELQLQATSCRVANSTIQCTKYNWLNRATRYKTTCKKKNPLGTGVYTSLYFSLSLFSKLEV